jgi:hypothetical protein
MLGASWFALAVGVCNNPESVPFVSRTDATSWNNKRPRGVAFAFQVVQHLVESHANVTINVFENAPSGSFVCNNSKDFRPDVAVIFRASLLPCDTEGLAGISSCEDVTVGNISFWVIS